MDYVKVQGVEVPALGLGTFELSGQECRDAVEHALSIGYRHIDTAQSYANQKDVGAALRRSEVAREDVFLTTKLWHTQLRYDNAVRSIDDSLARLGTDYIDLLLIHWPVQNVELERTFKAMKEAKKKGKVRFLGVSNFTPSLVEEASNEADLFCNQVEYHPFLSQARLLEQARKKEMMLTAYSPLARGRVNDTPVLSEIGEKYAKSAAQVTLRWLIQQESVAAIPKSTSAEHREANFDIFDFELSEEEMNRIHNLDRSERLIDPSFAPAWER